MRRALSEDERNEDRAWQGLARDHLSAGRVLQTTVRGHSMWPLLRDGQSVAIAPRSASTGNIRVGDVVLVTLGDKLVLHRVVVVTPRGVITKGDAVAWRDPEVDGSAVIGVVEGGPLGYWVATASRAGGALLAAGLRKLRVALRRLA